MSRKMPRLAPTCAELGVLCAAWRGGSEFGVLGASKAAALGFRPRVQSCDGSDRQADGQARNSVTNRGLRSRLRSAHRLKLSDSAQIDRIRPQTFQKRPKLLDLGRKHPDPSGPKFGRSHRDLTSAARNGPNSPHNCAEFLRSGSRPKHRPKLAGEPGDRLCDCPVVGGDDVDHYVSCPRLLRFAGGAPQWVLSGSPVVALGALPRTRAQALTSADWFYLPHG